MSAQDRSSAGPPPMTGAALVITAIALALGTFMQVLDTTIANVSIPTIAGNLGVSASQGTWVITSFSVANGVSVPLTGWLMGRYGLVKTFVGAVVLFTIASFLCGVSWNLPSLILFRVLQGAVSGPLIPGSQALLIMIFPPTRRGAALALWSMTTLVAPIAGPVMGGYISDNFSWPWIFFINVPVGGLCAFVCWRNMAGRETPTRKAPIDVTGLALLAVWVGALQIMLDTGKDADWFSSPAIVVETLVAAVGFIAFVIWELTEKNPIVDLSLFRSRNFALGALAFCLAYAVFFGNNLLLPLWLQTRVGYIATWAGLVAAPSGLVAVLLTPFASRLMNQLDARWVATVSMLAFALSYNMRAGYTPDADFVALAMPLLMQGVAMSTFFLSLITITLSGVPPRQLPSATGLSNFARISAGSFAASLTSTFWERGAAVHQTRLAENAAFNNPTWVQTTAQLSNAGMSAQQVVGSLTQRFIDQAFFLSTLDFFRVSAWLALLLIPIIWLTKKPAAGDGPPPGAD